MLLLILVLPFDVADVVVVVSLCPDGVVVALEHAVR